MTPGDVAAQEGHKEIASLLRACEEEARAEANMAKMEKAYLEAKELSKTTKASHAKAIKVWAAGIAGRTMPGTGAETRRASAAHSDGPRRCRVSHPLTLLFFLFATLPIFPPSFSQEAKRLVVEQEKEQKKIIKATLKMRKKVKKGSVPDMSAAASPTSFSAVRRRHGGEGAKQGRGVWRERHARHERRQEPQRAAAFPLTPSPSRWPACPRGSRTAAWARPSGRLCAASPATARAAGKRCSVARGAPRCSPTVSSPALSAYSPTSPATTGRREAVLPALRCLLQGPSRWETRPPPGSDVKVGVSTRAAHRCLPTLQGSTRSSNSRTSRNSSGAPDMDMLLAQLGADRDGAQALVRVPSVPRARGCVCGVRCASALPPAGPGGRPALNKASAGARAACLPSTRLAEPSSTLSDRQTVFLETLDLKEFSRVFQEEKKTLDDVQKMSASDLTVRPGTDCVLRVCLPHGLRAARLPPAQRPSLTLLTPPPRRRRSASPAAQDARLCQPYRHCEADSAVAASPCHRRRPEQPLIFFARAGTGPA